MGDWSPGVGPSGENPTRGYRVSVVARVGSRESKVLSVEWASSILLMPLGVKSFTHSGVLFLSVEPQQVSAVGWLRAQ